jgi:hypothetical protein
MTIYTVYFKEYSDDYYAPHNRSMFIKREDAEKCLDDLLNYNGIQNYYILAEEVLEEYTPLDVESDWECSYGTIHPATDNCNCDEYYEYQDLKNECDLNALESESYEG